MAAAIAVIERPEVLVERVASAGAQAGHGFYPYPPGAHEAAIARRDAKLFSLLKIRAGWDP